MTSMPSDLKKNKLLRAEVETLELNLVEYGFEGRTMGASGSDSSGAMTCTSFSTVLLDDGLSRKHYQIFNYIKR